MKPKSQIIAEQESIGNVEITLEQYHTLDKARYIYENGEYLYFAPRDVVYPDEKIGCGKGFEMYNPITCFQSPCESRIWVECNKEHLCPACQQKIIILCRTKNLQVAERTGSKAMILN
jgi:hypothetical protein